MSTHLSEESQLPIPRAEGRVPQVVPAAPFTLRKTITLRRFFHATVAAVATLSLAGVTMATAGRPEAEQRAPRQLALVESHEQTARPRPKRNGMDGEPGPPGPTGPQGVPGTAGTAGQPGLQ